MDNIKVSFSINAREGAILREALCTKDGFLSYSHEEDNTGNYYFSTICAVPKVMRKYIVIPLEERERKKEKTVFDNMIEIIVAEADGYGANAGRSSEHE